MDKWDDCGGVVSPYDLEGRACYGGLDLSSTSDLTTLVLVFPPNDETEPYIVLPFFWLPEETLQLRVRRDHVMYDKTTESDQDVEIGRRYAIMQKGAQPQYLLPVKFLGGNTAYDVYAPRESIRIKMKGGGLNFVHGGISLQEMVVPVIEYHFLRNQSKEYKKNKSKYDTKPVEISLLSANRKISNMIFSLNFYQKDAVGGNREAATYQLYFTDSSGKAISDVQKIIADKTSDNGQERTFRCSFNLKSLKYSNTETYYLVIADENGLQMQREEFQIDIAFAVDEFDFFG